MKFSVKKLFTATLFIALLINGVVNIFAIQDLDEKVVELRFKVPIMQSQTINFEERKLVLQRAHDATEIRKQEFEDYYKEFDRRALANNQFEDLNPSDVRAIPIPALSPRSVDGAPVVRERFRLWLPESNRYQLRVEFRNPVDLELQLINEFEPQSDLFDFSDNNVFAIPSGESIIQTEWIGNLESEKNFRIAIDGKTVFEANSAMPLELSSHFGWGQTNNVYDKVYPTCIAGFRYHVVASTEAKKEVMLVRLISLDKEEINE